MVDSIEDILNKYEEDKSYAIYISAEDHPEPIYKMVNKTFQGSPIKIKQYKNVSYAQLTSQNKLTLYESGEKIAESDIQKLKETILLTNSDKYKTQYNQLERLNFPQIIIHLTDQLFNLQGFPYNNYKKLMLILVSRYIENLSFQHGGQHYASFQEISRINDENGTLDIYNTLDSCVDKMNLYGVPDKMPPLHFENTNIHLGTEETYQKMWTVIHISEQEKAALLAVDKGKNEWKSIWTFDDQKVHQIRNNIVRKFNGQHQL